MTTEERLAALLVPCEECKESPEMPGRVFLSELIGSVTYSRWVTCPACHGARYPALLRHLSEQEQKIADMTEKLEPWFDGELSWNVPTAWAYAQACKVINGRHLSAEQRADKASERIKEQRYSNPWTVEIRNQVSLHWQEFAHDAPLTLKEAEKRMADHYRENVGVELRVVPWLNLAQRQHAVERIKELERERDGLAETLCLVEQELPGYPSHGSSPQSVRELRDHLARAESRLSCVVLNSWIVEYNEINRKWYCHRDHYPALGAGATSQEAIDAAIGEWRTNGSGK